MADPEVAPVTISSKVICWESAMTQVCDDQDFLNEVLTDLKSEVEAAQSDIQNYLNSEDFDGLMKAAHRVKGTTSYLCCEKLRDLSLQLQCWCVAKSYS